MVFTIWVLVGMSRGAEQGSAPAGPAVQGTHHLSQRLCHESPGPVRPLCGLFPFLKPPSAWLLLSFLLPHTIPSIPSPPVSSLLPRSPAVINLHSSLKDYSFTNNHIPVISSLEFSGASCLFCTSPGCTANSSDRGLSAFCVYTAGSTWPVLPSSELWRPEETSTNTCPGLLHNAQTPENEFSPSGGALLKYNHTVLFCIFSSFSCMVSVSVLHPQILPVSSASSLMFKF